MRRLNIAVILGAIVGVLALVVPYFVFAWWLTSSTSVSGNYSSGQIHASSAHRAHVYFNPDEWGVSVAGEIKGRLNISKGDDFSPTSGTKSFGFQGPGSYTETLYLSLSHTPRYSGTYRCYANTQVNATGSDGFSATNNSSATTNVTVP